MRLSKYFLPILRNNPQDATIKSHKFMIRSGMVRQLASGIYSWLPLGLKVLDNIIKVIDDEMEKSGSIKIMMSSIQPAILWNESGRLDAYGKEMLRIKDRHDNDILYGPTCEEVVTDIFRKNVTSYRELPVILYQITSKFRDEIRPRFGVMRGREFMMKDGYSFDLDYDGAKKSYDLMCDTYIKIFKRLGLKAIPVKADTGAIGGDLSHEFQIIADTGESTVYYDPKLNDLLDNYDNVTNIAEIQTCYAVADDLYDETQCPIAKDKLAVTKAIEVGHVFYFGDKYTKSLNATIQNAEGKSIFPLMGSYGIGVSRLVAAIIEVFASDNAINWPIEVAPFKIGLINLKPGDITCDKISQDIYDKIQQNKIDIIYDDKIDSVGSKFATMDLIGAPLQIIVGPKNAANGVVELKINTTGEKEILNVDDIIEKCLKILQ